MKEIERNKKVETLMVRMDSDLKEKFFRKAISEDLSASQVMRKLMKEYVGMKKKEKLKK